MNYLQLVAIVVHEYDPAIRCFFLRVDDFTAHYERMIAAGVEFVRPPRGEPYGDVAVFLDIAGNRWDLLGALGARLLEARVREESSLTR